ncbi:MAG: hypothetical protein AB1716_01595 [Planctomycetota bacterium]
MRRRRVWYLVVGVPVLLVGSCYGLAQMRYRHYAERDGWVWESSHAVLGCNVCTGRMERFTWQGRDVPLPRVAADPGRGLLLELYTPVGHVRYCEYGDGTRSYRPFEWLLRTWPESGEAITAEELTRGWYDVEDSAVANVPATTTAIAPATASTQSANGTVESGVVQGWGARKRGTPAHWCLGQGYSRQCWVDPAKIDQVEW